MRPPIIPHVALPRSPHWKRLGGRRRAHPLKKNQGKLREKKALACDPFREPGTPYDSETSRCAGALERTNEKAARSPEAEFLMPFTSRSVHRYALSFFSAFSAAAVLAGCGTPASSS